MWLFTPAFAADPDGAVLERSGDRAIVARWAGDGQVELVAVTPGGLQRVDVVPDAPQPTERCGVAHHEVTLPVGTGTAAFCLAAGGPPRLDGPIEVQTPAWRAIGLYRDGQRVGAWRLTDAAGRPLAEGEYQRDLPTGAWTVRGQPLAAGDGTPSQALALRDTGLTAESEPTVEVVSADLVEGQVAVRIRWTGSACDGLAYEVLRPDDPNPEDVWVVSASPCPTPAERADRLAKVRAGLAARHLDAIAPPPALALPAELEGHRIEVRALPAPDLASLAPAEIVARLPWLEAVPVEAAFEDVAVEHLRAWTAPKAPVVAAERGRWAVVFASTTHDPDGWRIAVAVGPVHSVAEGL